MKRNLMALLVSIAMGCGAGEPGTGVGRSSDGTDRLNAHEIMTAGDAELVTADLAGIVQPIVQDLATQSQLMLREAHGTATVRGTTADATINFATWSVRTAHGVVTLDGTVHYQAADGQVALTAQSLDIDSNWISDTFDLDARSVAGRYTGTLTGANGDTIRF